MKGYLYSVFAGRKTGPGSRDKQGFSHNGEFFSYLATSAKDAERQFRVKHKGYNIYHTTKKKSIKYKM